MKILITGKSVLADLLEKNIGNTHICRVEDILRNEVVLSEYDVFINYAHVDFKQVWLLQEVFTEWRSCRNKTIINISSRAAQPNISRGYMYAAQKAALNHYANNIQYNCIEKECKVSTLNLGLMDHMLPSLDWNQVFEIVRLIIYSKIEIPELTMQNRSNYMAIQEAKDKLLRGLL